MIASQLLQAFAAMTRAPLDSTLRREAETKAWWAAMAVRQPWVRIAHVNCNQRALIASDEDH